jgi:asparagine synthase (glutamine-hydrolysing)
MCGIAGIFDSRRNCSTDELRSHVAAMANTLRHRGPDDDGVWVAADGGIAFGFRRLSIVDVSVAGHQPMASASRRYTVIFNGEIYNDEELRAALLAEVHPLTFRGHSDTEVMLAAFERWGIEGALKRFNGMFALAVWDNQTRTLSLSRDRMGEKPLYYGWFDNLLLFGSELKALRAHPAFDDEIDRSSLSLLLRFNCIPSPHTIHSRVRKLPPATILSVSGDATSETSTQYWSLDAAFTNAHNQPFSGTDAEATNLLESALRESVKLRMHADVPLGAFLSGGVDSSTVVALMQSASSRPVHTFTIGVTDSGYDEAADARAVARHLGTDHTELYVTPPEIQSVVPMLADIYDEPFADSSQLPTYTVARLTRRQVTVALSGDGGDELFGGYNRYLWVERVWKATGWLPSHVRRLLALSIASVPVSRWNAIYGACSPLLPSKLRQRLPGEKLHKISGVLSCLDPRDMYAALTSHWQHPADLVIGASSPHTNPNLTPSPCTSLVEYMMYSDATSYLPDDILVKLDRATMAASLEARVPMLDHHLVEFASRLPLRLKIRNGVGKWILRQVLYKYVPAHLIERPKMGFGVPLHAWLRGPLRSWAEALLDSTRLRNEGFFDPAVVRSTWLDHLSGKHDWGYHLWDILMFQSWLQACRSRKLEAVAAS